jgi:hypothetical protein
LHSLNFEKLINCTDAIPLAELSDVHGGLGVKNQV